MNEQDYSNKFHLELELEKGYARVKEYNNKGKLVFEGEYLNGKGLNNKIYNNNNIRFNLNNGHNQVKLFDNIGKLLFDGIYLYKEKLTRKGK